MQDKKYNSELSKYFKLDQASPSGLRWIAKYGKKGSTVKIGDVVGSLDKKDGYWRIHALGGHYKAHKVVWAMYNDYKDQSGFTIDHIDHNRSNNAITNLRLVPHSINCRNRSRSKNNTTGANGVSFSERIQSTGKYFSKYTSVVYTKAMKKQSKSFSVQKYGDKAAYEMAVEWRNKTLSMLNSNGFDYHENHGKL